MGVVIEICAKQLGGSEPNLGHWYASTIIYRIYNNL
jgi:hypothetical protein